MKTDVNIKDHSVTNDMADWGNRSGYVALRLGRSEVPKCFRDDPHVGKLLDGFPIQWKSDKICVNGYLRSTGMKRIQFQIEAVRTYP